MALWIWVDVNSIVMNSNIDQAIVTVLFYRSNHSFLWGRGCLQSFYIYNIRDGIHKPFIHSIIHAFIIRYLCFFFLHIFCFVSFYLVTISVFILISELQYLHNIIRILIGLSEIWIPDVSLLMMNQNSISRSFTFFLTRKNYSIADLFRCSKW